MTKAPSSDYCLFSPCQTFTSVPEYDLESPSRTSSPLGSSRAEGSFWRLDLTKKRADYKCVSSTIYEKLYPIHIREPEKSRSIYSQPLANRRLHSS